MQELGLGTAFETHVWDLEYLESQLLARTPTKALAIHVTPLVETGATLRAELATKGRALVRAQALADAADDDLDDAIGAVHADLHASVGGNRDAEIFQLTFPRSLSETIRPALETQIDIAKKIIKALDEADPNVRDKHTPILAVLVEKGSAAQNALNAAEDARNLTFRAIRRFKKDSDSARTTIYGSLVAIAPKSVKAKKWADRFFILYERTPPKERQDVNNETGEPGTS